MKTIFQRIIEAAGEGIDLSSVPAFLFFRIFDPEIKRIVEICSNAKIQNRKAESAVFELQLDRDSSTDRHLHELLCVETSRRMIETELHRRDFNRAEDLEDGHTFGNPHLRALEGFKISVTLHRTTFKRRNS